MTSTALRWWHTLRHLRAIQIYGRLWFRLHRPRIDTRVAPKLRRPVDRLRPAPGRAASLERPWRFRFLNEVNDLDAMSGWDDPGVSRLWRYNLHYFDDLVADDFASRAPWHHALLTKWVAENPPAGGTGWEPYPISLRAVNWIRWSLAGNVLPPECVNSLTVQIRWLSGRLEHHLLGNHLWANAKALVFAGVFFEGPEADGWRSTGLRLLQRELLEQVLADGGHFERSPMYHAVILADLLELCGLASVVPGVLPATATTDWRARIPNMLRWLAAMTHPDGDIAAFNDSALGIGLNWRQLSTEALLLGIEHVHTEGAVGDVELSESGYVRLQRGVAVLIADVGLIGPDYIPGHAHADTLSFELSLHGHRVIVDSGTSRYDVSAERAYQRSTAAHNTVTVDGEDSSEVWSSFRVARRARPFDRTLSIDSAEAKLGCAHNGYLRLRGRAVHRREWRLTKHALRIRDTVEGGFDSAVARYHLHPLAEIAESGANEGVVRLPGGHAMRWRAQGGKVDIAGSTHHPQFSVSLPNQCLELRLHGAAAEIEFTWD